MKTSNDILDLPIITISEGKQIGKVNGLIINPETFSVDFLTVEQEEWQISLKAIPYQVIVGVGEFAIMIEEEKAVIDLNGVPIINQLINKQVHLIGSRVLTKSGELSGRITEYYLNKETGKIEHLSVQVTNKEVLLPIENVITLGSEHVIINNTLEDLNEPGVKQESSLINPGQNLKESASPIDMKEALKGKLVELLKGNSIKRNIYSKSGELLFEKGTVLTADDIKILQEQGAKVLIEIATNPRV